MGNENKEEMREDALLEILSQNYESLYYVDFDNNTIKPYRMSKVIEEKFGAYFRTSPSYEDAMTGYIKSVVSPLDQEEMLKRAKPEFLRNKMKDKRTYSYDFRVNRDGEEQYFRFKISNLDGIGELHQAAVGFADVTSEMDRVNQLIESQALLSMLEYDRLTGLCTKEFFFKRVRKYIADHPDEELVLWTSDVEGLKVINDKYGMDKGDEVLQHMALGSGKFPGFLFGGRVEGDKFSALMTNQHVDYNKVNAIMENSTADFPVPNVIIKHGIYEIKQNDSLTVQGMYDRTVLALQSIKNVYGKYVAVYDDNFREKLLMHRQIVEDANSALRRGEFQVYYQPKVDAETGEVSGAEALVRWIHPEIGFMNPGVFIPLFEQNGFITKLDFFIWEEVCKALVEWEIRGVPTFPISVNISRRDFDDPNLAERIIHLVDKYHLDHSKFQVEITESSYVDNPEVIENTVKQLHDAGFLIAIDDFGTGYSSMMALSSLDLDIMKLDMSLIQNDVPGTAKNVLEFSMQLAKMLQLKTVAEGVETDNQAARIRDLGGDYIQGYFYSKPLPKDEFEKYLMENE